MDRFKNIMEGLMDYARQDTKVKAVVMTGSSAQKDRVSDANSEPDLVIITDEPSGWLDGTIPAKFGKVCITILSSDDHGVPERRVLYEGYRDVGYRAFTPEECSAALNEGRAYSLFERGFRVLYDTTDITSRIQPDQEMVNEDLEGLFQDDYITLCSEYFYKTIWAAKKIQRGEYWEAATCVNGWLKQAFLKILLFRMQLDAIATWHNGRSMEEWADSSILDPLRWCFAEYDRDSIITALVRSMSLFSVIAEEIADCLDYQLPYEEEEIAETYLKKHFSDYYYQF